MGGACGEGGERTGTLMTVVVNTRDDFTLANFRRVSYGGEPIRVGAQALRAMTAVGGPGATEGSAAPEPPPPGPGARAWRGLRRRPARSGGGSGNRVHPPGEPRVG